MNLRTLILFACAALAGLAQPAAPSTPPADSLAAYAGTYDTGFARMEVTVEEGHLMLQPKGNDKMELVPESEGKFVLKTSGMKVDFTKNNDGKVTEIVLHVGANELRASKK
jgi:hypothetical protein